MADILVSGGVVVTLDPERRVIEDGAVAITGDRVIAVGPRVEIEAAHPAPRRIDARRKAILPGLIDAHAHAGHGLVKTMAGPDGEAWTEACRVIYTTGSDPRFWYAEARLAALERLMCGVTTGVSLLGGGDSIMRTDDPRHGERHADGVGEVGIRAMIAVGPTRGPHPRVYRSYAGPGADAGHSDREVRLADQMAVCAALVDRRQGSADGRIRFAAIAPVFHTSEARDGDTPMSEVTDLQLTVRAFSRDRGIPFTQDGHKLNSIELSHDLFGATGPDAFFSHSVDLTPRAIDLCRETGTRIVHNPSAVMSIRGRCPVPELIEAGVTVCLGSDGTAPDRGADMFRHMWQAMHYHRRHFRDARVLPPGKVLEMCTIDAARALGMDHEIGSLEAGKKADVILVDLAKPHMYPPNMPVYRVVCFASGADVDTVIVDGRVLMEGRRVIHVETEAILEDARIATEVMIARTGLGRLLETPPGFWGGARY